MLYGTYYPGVIGFGRADDGDAEYRCTDCITRAELAQDDDDDRPIWQMIAGEPYDYRPACSHCGEPLPVHLTPEGVMYAAHYLDPDAMIELVEDDAETSRRDLELLIQDFIRECPGLRIAIRDALAPFPDAGAALAYTMPQAPR